MLRLTSSDTLTVVAAGETLDVPSGQSGSNYEVLGELDVAGTASGVSVGGLVSQADEPGQGVLDVLAGGTATSVTLAARSTLESSGLVDGVSIGLQSQVSVLAGGHVDGLTARMPQSSGVGAAAGQAVIDVEAGGQLTNATLVGGTITVAGSASTLGAGNEAVSISGTVDGLSVSGTLISADRGFYAGSMALTSGGVVNTASFSDFTTGEIGAGGVANALTLSGGQYNDQVFQAGSSYRNLAAAVTVDSGGQLNGATAGGTSDLAVAGNASDLTLNDQALASVTGRVVGVMIDSSSYNANSIFFDAATYDPLSTGGQALPDGLVVGNGGFAANVTDNALEVVQSGGVSVNAQIEGTQIVDSGGLAYDDTIGAPATVLNNGTLVYSENYVFRDAGNIVTDTVVNPNPSQSSPQAALTFGTGNIVEQGPGTLILAGNNSFSGGISIGGGTVEIASLTGAGMSAVSFASGVASTLRLDQGSFVNSILGLAAGDVIDLAGTAYEAGDQAILSPGGRLNLVAPGGASRYALNAEAASGSVGFTVQSDAQGGTEIVATTLAGTIAGLGRQGASQSLTGFGFTSDLARVAPVAAPAAAATPLEVGASASIVPVLHQAASAIAHAPASG